MIIDGDTCVVMPLPETAIVTDGILTGEFCDSALAVASIRNKVSQVLIRQQNAVIETLTTQASDLKQQVKSAKLINVADAQICEATLNVKDDEIKGLKKSLRRQKIYKVMVMVGIVALPVAVIFLKGSVLE